VTTEAHRGEPVIEHPNRAKSASKISRVVMVVLLIASAVLMTIIIIGGWDALMGMQFVALGWVAIYLLFAYYVARWNRGVLPVIAALAVIMLIFAVIAVPSWIDRDSADYAETTLGAGLLATLAAILVALQAVVAVAAGQAFSQAWNVEVEHWPEDDPDYVPAST
jgi:prepilin signal peptidase PulO-like enzyme (type II secretory pathway)